MSRNMRESATLTNGRPRCMVDYDRDSLLDLVVTNYVRFSFENPKKCEVNGMRSYASRPRIRACRSHSPQQRRRTFSDMSAPSGFDKLVGRAWES